MSIMMAMAAVLAVATAAKQPETTAAPTTEEEPPCGGYVNVGGEGRLAIVDCCQVGDDAVGKAVAVIGKSLMIEVGSAKGTWSLQTAENDKKACGATAAVFLVKDKSLPISLVAMEARWGVVNAEGLTAEQLGKEIIRVSLVVLGCASSRYQTSFMRPAFSAADLDKVGSGFTIDTIMAVFPNLPDHGIRQFRTITFRDACEQGLAPTPRNEEERKIAAEYKTQK